MTPLFRNALIATRMVSSCMSLRRMFMRSSWFRVSKYFDRSMSTAHSHPSA